MRDLQLTFVGSGNAFSPGGLCCNGFVVNNRFLFEAPPQALQSLNRLKYDANDLDAIILSHHHGDHFLGLPFLFLHFKYKGRTRPIRVVGPRGTEELAKDIAERVFPGAFDANYGIEWIIAEAGHELALDGLSLSPVAVDHDDRLTQSLGFAGVLGGRRFAYTGDTRLCAAVLDLARHSEVLVSECASRDAQIPIHMNLVDDIPAVRDAMKQGAKLLLTHIDSDVDPVGLPNTAVAKDFKTYCF